MGENLIIIGGGAAGLMAGCTAGRLGLSAMVLERRHRPGLKLLMCGNNRCNISHDADAEEMRQSYGDPVGGFLRQALSQFPPSALRSWFGRLGMATVVKKERIYPASEDADDVLHCFLDELRDLRVPLALNAPVAAIEKTPDGFRVALESGFSLESRHVLIATGGVSFPKTGSVGDGLKFASALHHKVTPLRPGLAGVEIEDGWLAQGHESDVQDAAVRIFSGGRLVAETYGNILFAGAILRGTAVFDAVRLISRRNLTGFSLELDFFAGMSEGQLSERLPQKASAQALYQDLGRLEIPADIAEALARRLAGNGSLERILKHLPVRVSGIRPLKEAIVTVGGVSLEEIDPLTMESRICPGLYFAGEVMDVDGPTGGYNLHAAFASARLAVNSIADKCGLGRKVPAARGESVREARVAFRREEESLERKSAPQTPRERYADPRTASRAFGRNDSWGMKKTRTSHR